MSRRTILSLVQAAGVGVLSAAVATAQISPGPLTWAHRELDGTAQCTSCHRLGAGEAAFTCLACHTEIGSRLREGRGLHASYGLSPESGKDCVRCHSEHNGREFRLVHWEPEKLDHSETGYPLEGKHRDVKCRVCHAAARVGAREREAIKVKDPGRTFLGLPRECAACHQDRHEGRLGDRCQDCHGLDDWRKADVRKLDHGKTRYPLLGRHAQVACERCHTAGVDGRVRYAGIPFDACSRCHTDPHRGSFAGACASCHVTDDWKTISGSALQAGFDHGRTDYPLRGKHAAVPCARCHAGSDFKRAVLHDRCTRCHVTDPHRGRFADRPGGVECSSCHTVESFRATTWAAVEHAATDYPLEGRHATVACAKCHPTRGGEVLFAVPFGRCTDCHQDQHGGQFAAAADGGRCEGCHTTAGYRPSTFTIARHASAKFALAGGHLAVPCADCHRPIAGTASAGSRYRFQDLGCTGCHADPHRGQFEKWVPEPAASGSDACGACHVATSWKDLAGFDHGRTRFALLGSHRATPCIDCHRPPSMEVTMRNVDFAAAPTECQDCHADVHGRQFQKDGTTPCAGCHGAGSWRPSTFDHDRASFVLDGRHRNVRCGKCHTLTKPVEGKAVVFYRPTPKECAACHGPAT